MHSLAAYEVRLDRTLLQARENTFLKIGLEFCENRFGLDFVNGESPLGILRAAEWHNHSGDLLRTLRAIDREIYTPILKPGLRKYALTNHDEMALAYCARAKAFHITVLLKTFTNVNLGYHSPSNIAHTIQGSLLRLPFCPVKTYLLATQMKNRFSEGAEFYRQVHNLGLPKNDHHYRLNFARKFPNEQPTGLLYRRLFRRG